MSDFSIRGWLGLDAQDFNQKLGKSGVDAKKFSQDANALGDKMSWAFMKTTAAVGGVSGAIAFLVSQVKGAIEMAGELNDMSSSLSMSTGALQEFKFAFTQTGSKMEDFAAGVIKMTDAVEKAREGNAEAIDLFKKLGLTVEDLKTLKLEDIFDRAGKAAADIKDPVEQIRTAVELFGKKGAALMPAFKEGMDALRESAREAGQVMGDWELGQLDNAGDKLDALWTRIKVMSGQVTAGAMRPGDMLLGVVQAFTGKDVDTAIGAEMAGLNLDKRIKAFNEKRAARLAEKNPKPKEETEKERQERVKKEIKEAEDKAKRVAKLEEDLALKRRAFLMEQMTPEQKLNALMEERAALAKNIFNDQEKNLLNSKRIYELEDEIRRAKKEVEAEAKKEQKKEGFHAPKVNELVARGGFQSVAQMQTLIRNQDTMQRQLLAASQRTASATVETAATLRNARKNLVL